MEDVVGPPVDWTANTALFGGREEMGREFFRRFVELTGPIMGALGEAAARIDMDEVARMAHQVKGGSGSVAATLVHRYAEELEAAARAGRTSDVRSRMERLAEAWAQVTEYAKASE